MRGTMGSGKRAELKRDFDADIRISSQQVKLNDADNKSAKSKVNWKVDKETKNREIDDLSFAQNTKNTSRFGWIWAVIFIVAVIAAICASVFR